MQYFDFLLDHFLNHINLHQSQNLLNFENICNFEFVYQPYRQGKFFHMETDYIFTSLKKFLEQNDQSSESGKLLKGSTEGECPTYYHLKKLKNKIILNAFMFTNSTVGFVST